MAQPVGSGQVALSPVIRSASDGAQGNGPPPFLNHAIHKGYWSEARNMILVGAAVDLNFIYAWAEARFAESFQAGTLDEAAKIDADLIECLKLPIAIDRLRIYTMALSYRRLPVVRYLIETGVDVNVRDIQGISSLYYALCAVEDDTAFFLVENPNFNIDEPMVPYFAAGSPLSVRVPHYLSGTYPVHGVVLYGTLKLLQAALYRPDINLDRVNGFGQTALRLAMTFPTLEKAKLLVQAGASTEELTEQDKARFTAQAERLIFCQYQHSKKTEIDWDQRLIDLEAMDEEILEWLRLPVGIDRIKVFVQALRYKNGSAVEFLLNHGMDPNQDLDGFRPLFFVCYVLAEEDDEDAEEILGMFLKLPEVNVNHPVTPKNGQGGSVVVGVEGLSYPIHVVAAHGSLVMFEDICQRPEVDLSCKNEAGQTAFDVAVSKRRWEHAGVFADYGYAVSLDMEPLEEALKTADEEEAKEIRNLITDINCPDENEDPEE